MMKSEKKVILVGEEHSDTSHMKRVADLVIQHLQNNKSVAVALEQNCGSRTIEELSCVSIPNSRARLTVIDTYIKDHPNSELSKQTELLEKLKQRKLEHDFEKKYIEYFINIDNEIEKNIDAFCVDMVFDEKEFFTHKLNYTISIQKMARHAFHNKKSLQLVSVDTKDDYFEESTNRDKSMYKNILKADVSIVIYPVGSAHIYNEGDGKNRLGALLIQDNSIELELANLYTKNDNFAYETVQKDIEKFKNFFKAEDVKVYNAQPEVLDKELSYSEEIKVRDEIVLKKPIFKVYKDKEFKGSNYINDHGLTLEDIEYNLRKILDLQQSIAQNEIKLSDKVLSFHIIPSKITEWLLLNNNVDEKTAYISIVEITDNSKHHACILNAMLRGEILYINIIDPLSEEDSIFKNQLEKLKLLLDKTLYQNGYTVECDIIYKGLQDSAYATCGDMCLIMVQELMYDQSVKYGRLLNTDLNSPSLPINVNELLSDISDYESTQVDMLGNYHDA